MSSKLKLNKVFIATPTHVCKRYCASEFLSETLKNAVIPYNCQWLIAGNSKGSCAPYYATKIPNVRYHDMDFGPEYYGKQGSIHDRITDTANYMRDQFLLTDCEWYLSIEADVMLTDKSMLLMMVERDVDVLHTDCYHKFNLSRVYCETKRVTMGCTLIKRHVLEGIKFRYDAKVLAAYYDALFANDCVDEGIKMYYDPSIKPLHKNDRLERRGWDSLPDIERKNH